MNKEDIWYKEVMGMEVGLHNSIRKTRMPEEAYEKLEVSHMFFKCRMAAMLLCRAIDLTMLIALLT